MLEVKTNTAKTLLVTNALTGMYKERMTDPLACCILKSWKAGKVWGGKSKR